MRFLISLILPMRSLMLVFFWLWLGLEVGFWEVGFAALSLVGRPRAAAAQHK
jgi:hypothetical protein